MNWTEAQYSDYQRRLAGYGEIIDAQRMRAYGYGQARQLSLNPRVHGLDKPKRINTCALEGQEAERLMRWVDGEGSALWPEVRWLYAIPNGGFRHKAVAGKMRAQGVRAGVPDFNLDVPRGAYHGLRIELKRRVGGTVSDAQKLWIAWLNNQGYLAIVCRGWEEARDTLVEYLSA